MEQIFDLIQRIQEIRKITEVWIVVTEFTENIQEKLHCFP